MKLVSVTIYAMHIPFVRNIKHSMAERGFSDSIIVRVRDSDGVEGFGEGVGRPYVTGETTELMIRHIAGYLWPAIAHKEVPSLIDNGLGAVDALLPVVHEPGVIAHNASRAALELAIIDAYLRRIRKPVSVLLPPNRSEVVYSGIIPGGTLEVLAQEARRFKLAGLKHIKIKVGAGDDVARVRTVREIVGPSVSIRIDANCAWTSGQAIEILKKLAPFDIAAIEQPISRGPAIELAVLRKASPIPIMVDESLVTISDAEELIAADAVDFFNIRVSKCGGLGRSLEIARRAFIAGIRVQVGCQVGETGILSMAGRHLAAALDAVSFVEGSPGTNLLVGDITCDDVRWGDRGVAKLPSGHGLGIQVMEEKLKQYATTTSVRN